MKQVFTITIEHDGPYPIQGDTMELCLKSSSPFQHTHLDVTAPPKLLSVVEDVKGRK